MHVQPDTLATARSHPRASVYAEHVHQGRQWAGRSGSLAREALQDLNLMPLSRLGCPLSLKTPNKGNPGLNATGE